MPIHALPRRHSNQRPPAGRSMLDGTHPLVPGLVFCPPLNEYSGSPRDLVQRASGTLANVSWDADRLQFAFTGSVVSWPANANLRLTTFSVTLLFCLTGALGTSSLVTQCSNSPSGWWIGRGATSTSGTVGLLVGGGQTSVAPVAVSTGVWYWLTITVAGTAVNSYLTVADRSADMVTASGTASAISYAGTEPFTLGDGSQSQSALCEIAFCCMHNTALQQSQVRQLHAEPFALYQAPSLSRFIPLLAVQKAASESGAASDTADASATVPASDSAIGGEGATVTLGPTDAASGGDAGSASATAPSADAGAGTDTPAASATIPVADSAAGAEDLSVGVLATDAATGADAGDASATIPANDAAAGVETPSVGVLASDAASGSSSQQITVPVLETATGHDAVSYGALTNTAEGATGTDTPSQALGRPTIAQGDTGTLATKGAATIPTLTGDTWELRVSGTLIAADYAPGSWVVAFDGTTFTVTVPPDTLTSIGTGFWYTIYYQWSASPAAPDYAEFDVVDGAPTIISVSDGAAGADDIGGSGQICSVGDSAAGGDVLTAAATIDVAEAGAGGEDAIGPGQGLTVEDDAVGSDLGEVGLYLMETADLGLGAEVVESTNDLGDVIDGAQGQDVAAAASSGDVFVIAEITDGAAGSDLGEAVYPTFAMTDTAAGTDTPAAPFQTSAQRAVWWD